MLKKKKKQVEDVLKILYGTEVPRPKLGLDFRVGSTTPFFKSLLYAALVSYKSESCSLTNAWQDFPEQRIKENPTYHRILSSFLGTSLRAYVPELEPSSKATILVFYSYLNIHLEQIILDLTTGHICLN